MKKFFIFFSICICLSVNAQKLPNGFVYLNTIDNTIASELRYISNNNFIGKPINGYHKNIVIISTPAAKALAKIQKELLKDSLSLKIFDAYRPQQSVNHFVEWAQQLNDTLMKHQYYPKVKKSELFNLGYIASKSGHTRGGTVDLTIIDLKTNKELDMGSPYDFFGDISHVFSDKISLEQKENRMLLRKVMLNYNFRPYQYEWWHFTLNNEPFPRTYFNFPIE
ncbi:M15 family metallopeptidase [Polaribacter sp.]|nr:M15 family metallopeptidase [Polaribacter sp.]